MTESPRDLVRSVLEAASFAARAHRHQLRKDGQTPYAAHPFRVCLIVRHVFGIEDPDYLAAALLHDTIEDTTTEFDDLEAQFGAKVARWVAALSKDKRLPEDEREAAYVAALTRAELAVKVAKLADIFDNLTDSRNLPARSRKRKIERSRMYIAALEHELPDAARRPMAIVRQLVEELAGTDASAASA
jgi:guanosine-3',5'-bis(diphosphate) 3'-pyrophosphohydrolase